MSKITPLSLFAKHAWPRIAFGSRVLLHASVLFVVALFPYATPSRGLLNASESETPIDEDESSEEEAISVQARARISRNQPGLSFVVPVDCSFRLATVVGASVPHSGHRLANNLLAPLRC